MKKLEKNTSQQQLRATIILGVMIFFILFLSNFISAFDWSDKIIAYYKFDETSGTIATDATGNGNNLNLTGGTPQSVAGKINTALNLTTGTAGVWANLTGKGYHLNDTGFTFSGWVKNTSAVVGNAQLFVFKDWLGWYANDAGFLIGTGSTSSIRVTNGTWFYITLTYDATSDNMTQWINGIPNGSSIQASTPFSELEFFGYDLGTKWNNTADEFGLWNRSLSASEISELYNGGVGLGYGGGGNSFNIVVDLLNPANAYQTLDKNITFTANNTISLGNFTNSTVYLWYSNGSLFGTNTTLLTGNTSGNTSLLISDINYGNYLWNFRTCGFNVTSLAISCFIGTSNFSLGIQPYSTNTETYNSTSFETKKEYFDINITTVSSVSAIGAFFHYNGTAYAANHTCSGNYCIISKMIDIPLITGGNWFENKSFFWQVTFFGSGLDSITQNSTTHQQNISNLSLIDCGGSVNTMAVNFTIKNESTDSLITADFDASFNYYLGMGTISKYYNYHGAGSGNYDFCINNNLTYITTSEVKIENDSRIRNYFFNKESYTNTSTLKTLFIPDILFSTIIIDVKNQGLVPMSNILVNISRFYPDENSYHMVESKRTDEFGQLASKLVENDVSYKFEFYDLNNKLLKTSDKINVVCRSSICILSFIIQDTENYFENFESNLSLFTGSLLFDNTTNIFTYSWDDQRGESSTIRLEVIRYMLNQSSIICDSSSLLKLSTLTCNVGSQDASYTAQVFRTFNGVQKRIDILNVKVGDTVSTYGVEGLLWSFILLFTCFGIGAFNPTAGASFFGIGFIFLGTMGIISMPLPVFFAVAAIVIVFIWAVNT